LNNAIASTVYSAHPGNVKYVIVDGKIVIERGKHVSADEYEIVKNARFSKKLKKVYFLTVAKQNYETGFRCRVYDKG